MQAETQEATQPNGIHARKPLRLKKARDFQRVRQQGRSVGTARLTLGWAPNASDAWRCGYTVGKRAGGAVTRNRIKRRLREITRSQIKVGQVAPGYDLVLIARPGAAEASYQELAADVGQLLRRARLWRDAPPEGTGSL